MKRSSYSYDGTSTSRNSRRRGRRGATRLGEDDFRAVSVRVDRDAITVVLDDGQEASASIAKYFPFLEQLTAAQLRRARLDYDRTAIYFPDIDEYASVFSVVHPERTVLAAPLRSRT